MDLENQANHQNQGRNQLNDIYILYFQFTRWTHQRIGIPRRKTQVQVVEEVQVKE